MIFLVRFHVCLLAQKMIQKKPNKKTQNNPPPPPKKKKKKKKKTQPKTKQTRTRRTKNRAPIGDQCKTRVTRTLYIVNRYPWPMQQSTKTSSQVASCHHHGAALMPDTAVGWQPASQYGAAGPLRDQSPSVPKCFLNGATVLGVFCFP